MDKACIVCSQSEGVSVYMGDYQWAHRECIGVETILCPECRENDKAALFPNGSIACGQFCAGGSVSRGRDATGSGG